MQCQITNNLYCINKCQLYLSIYIEYIRVYLQLHYPSTTICLNNSTLPSNDQLSVVTSLLLTGYFLLSLNNIVSNHINVFCVHNRYVLFVFLVTPLPILLSTINTSIIYNRHNIIMLYVTLAIYSTRKYNCVRITLVLYSTKELLQIINYKSTPKMYIYLYQANMKPINLLD